MDRHNIRQEVALVVVGWPRDDAGHARALPGTLTEWIDGRWLLFLEGVGSFHGDQGEGGREAVAALLHFFAPADPQND